MDWTQLVCVVTGASSGYGREACLRMAAKGATIVAAARREDRLKSLVSELGGRPHSYVVCDVSKLDQVRALGESVARSHGRIDVLLNNAGISTSGRLGEASSEEIEAVLRTNLIGAIWCLKETLPLLEAAPKRARTPVVVNLASMAGRVPAPGAGDYTASKFGLVGFTEAVWGELASKRIRCMMVNPGFTDTEGFPMTKVRAGPMGWAVMDAQRVVGAIIRGIERGAFEVRVQWWMHLVYPLTVVMGPFRKTITNRLRPTGTNFLDREGPAA